jgi:hypothetical protein
MKTIPHDISGTRGFISAGTSFMNGSVMGLKRFFKTRPETEDTDIKGNRKII